jgi:hypothetical protein
MDSLKPSSRHWKQWAIALRLEYSARPKSAPAIDESDSSSWPTISVGDAESGQTKPSANAKHRNGDSRLRVAAAQWSTPRASDGEKGGPNSRDGSGSLHLTSMATQSATPMAHDSGQGNPARVGRYGTRHGGRNLNDESLAWPTPISRDHRSIYAGEETMGKNSRPLSEAASRFSPRARQIPDGPKSSDERRTLNPRFVEWLLGWPDNWTVVSIGSAPAAMELSRWLRRMRGALLILLSAPTQAQPDQIPLFAEDVA